MSDSPLGQTASLDLFTWWARNLPLPRRRTEKIGPHSTRSYVPGIDQTAESDMPWVIYTYGRTPDVWWPLWRSTRVLGRAAIGMDCSVCGKREVVVLRIPRFGKVPEPDGGKHPERLRFLRDHAHPDRPAPMAWARPLANLDALPGGGLDIDALAMRLEADLLRAERGENENDGEGL